MRVTGPSTETYRTVGMTRSTIRLNRPAVSMSRAFRDPASVRTHASPLGAYWYQIGTVNGPRSAPADTDNAGHVRLGQKGLAIADRQGCYRP